MIKDPPKYFVTVIGQLQLTDLLDKAELIIGRVWKERCVNDLRIVRNGAK